jgi:hypothetical protein
MLYWLGQYNQILKLGSIEICCQLLLCCVRSSQCPGSDDISRCDLRATVCWFPAKDCGALLQPGSASGPAWFLIPMNQESDWALWWPLELGVANHKPPQNAKIRYSSSHPLSATFLSVYLSFNTITFSCQLRQDELQLTKESHCTHQSRNKNKSQCWKLTRLSQPKSTHSAKK